MQVYQKRITVSKDDLDDLNHVNNVRYLQWVQDVASEHWQQNVTQAILDQYFWVVVSHHIEYKSAAVLDDVIRIETYVTRSKGVTSTRIVEMYHDTTNKLLVKAETVWCLMNKSSSRPSRITPEIATLFN